MIEEFIKSTKLSVEDTTNGTNSQCGFTMRWSPQYECWLVGYGRPNFGNKGTGNGATLKYAINDFLEKQKQFQ